MTGEEGRRDDPNLRDESAKQGINTVKKSDHDDDNQALTKTAADDFRTTDDPDTGADPSFDEVYYD